MSNFGRFVAKEVKIHIQYLLPLVGVVHQFLIIMQVLNDYAS